MKKTESERMGELGWVRAALLIVLALLLHLIVSGCSEPGKATWDAGDWSMADAMPNCPESAAPPGGLAGSGCYAHECFNGCCQWVLAAEGAVCYQPHCTDTPGVCSSAEGTMQCIVSLDGGSVPVSTVDEALDLESLLLQGDHPCSIAQCTLAGAKLEDKCGSGDSGIPTPDGCFCPREFQVSVGAASQVDSKTLLTGDEALVALVEKNEEGKGRLLLRVFDTITTGKLAELSAPAGPNSDHTGFAWVPTGDGSDGDSGFLLAYMDNGVVYGWGVDWDTASAHLRTAAMPAELLPGVSNALEVDLALTDSGTVAALRYSGDKPDDGCARVVNLDAGLESPPVCHEGMTGMSLVSGQARIHLLLQMADGSAVVETFYDTLVPAATPILLGMKCEPDRPVAAAVFEGTFFATCRTSESTVVVEAFQPEVPGMKSSVDLGPGFDPTLRPLPPGMGGAPVGFMVMFGTTTVAGHCLRLARIEGNLTVDYMADPLPGTDSTRATPRLDFVYELAEPDLAVGGTYLRLPSGGAWYFASGADGTDSPLLPPVCAGKKCGDDGFGGSCGACEEGSVCQEGACIEQASPPCVPDCGGKECGDDGCEGVCGECDAGFVCKSGFCEDGGELPCDPDCEEKECGPDECGATCGECGEGLTCQDGICVEIECAADCEGKECGP
ncbi:MAG: hypothetical protein FJ109_14120, partial [Deltaproteobacteria bacterium]|nr:hypothetical protein [Deltaproteobacteria bacterium]